MKPKKGTFYDKFILLLRPIKRQKGQERKNGNDS